VRQFWPKQILTPIENVVSKGTQTTAEYLESDGWGWGVPSADGITVNQSVPMENSGGEGEVLVVPGSYVRWE
jgi:hypothetical protein